MFALVDIVNGTAIGPFESYEVATIFALLHGLVASHRPYPMTKPGDYNG